MSVPLRVRLIAAASVVGLAIALVDSRPAWDDTGVTAAALFAAAAAFAFAGRNRAWLWAILVGGWIPLLEIRGPAGAASLLAVMFAFGGAASGHLIARTRTFDDGVENRR